MSTYSQTKVAEPVYFDPTSKDLRTLRAKVDALYVLAHLGGYVSQDTLRRLTEEMASEEARKAVGIVQAESKDALAG